MTDLLTIGASGIRAYTAALGTVGDNIANSQTPGFVRRTVRTEEVPTGTETFLYNRPVSPGGVLASGVVRAVDDWLIEDARVAGSDAGQASARLTWLEATERVLGDGVGSVGSTMTALFNAVDQLATNPESTVSRASFLGTVSDVASAFVRTADGLARTAAGISADATNTVADLNTNLAALDRVNDGLARARGGSTNQAALLDDRDRLLDQVGSAVGISASYDARGVATVQLAPPSNEIMIGADRSERVALVVAADGGLSLTVGTTPFGPSSGRLAGLASSATDVADQRGKLDIIATAFATHVNEAHGAGLDPAGNRGAALFILGPGGAAGISARPLAAGDVAAADTARANGNLLRFAALRSATGGEANMATLVAQQSQTTASARAQDAAAAVRQGGADAARTDVSAVDLDREAADLLRFQQAYEGSARVLQVARETLQSILTIF